jgi:hypothetical protein
VSQQWISNDPAAPTKLADGASRINSNFQELYAVAGDIANLNAHLADTVDAHDASAISFVPSSTISATDVQAAILEAYNDALAALIRPDYLQGLELNYDNSTTLGIEVGSAYVESVGGLVTRSSRATLTFSGMTVNTFMYIYLTSAGTVISSATPPAAPYYGSRARSMQGDNTKRYLGEVLASGATTIYSFWHAPGPGLIEYRTNLAASPFLVLANSGLAAAETPVSLASVVPPTARLALCSLWHFTTVSCFLGLADDDFTLSTTSYWMRLYAQGSVGTSSTQDTFPIPLGASQTFTYMFSSAPSAGNGLGVRVLGYYLKR